MTDMSPEHLGVRRETGALLRGSWRLVRAGGARLAALILVSQLIIIAVAIPVIGWLYRQALRASGMHGLDMGAFTVGSGLPLTLALIFVIILLAFWLIAVQFTALVTLLNEPRAPKRAFLAELRRVARKIVRPNAAPLVLYLFLLVPLTGFGFASALTRGISIPLFVPGELEKSPGTAIGYALFMLLLALLNVRFALTVPLFVLSTTARPVRMSWRLTRLRRSVPLVIAAAVILACAGGAALTLTLVALVPTLITDAAAPGASVVTAAYSLGIAQVAGFMLSGLATALIAGVLITSVRRGAGLLPDGVALIAATANDPDPAPAKPRRRSGLIVTAAAALIALICGTANIDTMQRLTNQPDSLVLAHRGFSDGGVENTISALEAASAAGADLVEMDVMQTRDGEFVVMHDSNLNRLAGMNANVKDLTLAELTAITVHDRFGHEDAIPALAPYALRAKELDLPLLIEIKLSGAETPDHVAQLIAELEEIDALDRNIYHSLDAPSVRQLKLLRPDLTVGYTMAFAAVDVPDTPADFIVVEEWSATEKMQQAAIKAGLGFMVWTVNDDAGMREHLRRDSDGIVTDHPDQVLALREEMHEDTGLASVLVDALSRFVTIV